MDKESVIFQARKPFFNIDEAERLIGAIAGIDDKWGDLSTLDFSPYTWLGLHETQLLLLSLRKLSRIANMVTQIYLPSNSNVIKFLERWDFFKEIMEHTDEYLLTGAEAVQVINNGKISSYLEQLKKLDRSEEVLSNNLIEIKRIKEYGDAIDQVNYMHKLELKSIIMDKIQRNDAEVKEFINVIVFELLKNIVLHVLIVGQKNGAYNSARVGFISAQTHTKKGIEKFGFDNFKLKWPSFYEGFIYENRHGFAELSVVDDGAGLKDTILPLFLNRKKRKPENDKEIFEFACSPGTSRFQNMSEQEIAVELERLYKALSKHDIHANHGLNDEDIMPIMNGKLNASRMGYGLYLVTEKVKKWGGIILIRSGNSYYAPFVPDYRESIFLTGKAELPGVQVQILLPFRRFYE